MTDSIFFVLPLFHIETRYDPHMINPSSKVFIFYFEIFEMILSHGVSPNIIGRFSYRLAHHLAACRVVWKEPIMTGTDRIKFAIIWLKYKVDLNVIDDLLQSTPLSWVVRWG